MTDGTEWNSNDIFDPIRLNRKSRFVGNGTQINAISSPESGMCCFSTATASGFTVEKTYFRNSADNGWVSNAWVSDEYTTSPNKATSTTVTAANHNLRRYLFITLPSDYNFYKITHLEMDVEAQTGATGTCVMGADIVDSVTPSSTFTPLVAISQPFTVTGPVGQTTKKMLCSSKPVIAGTLLGLWFNISFSGSNNFLFYGTSTTRYYRTETYTASPPTSFNASWSTDTAVIPGIKVYAKGFL